MFPDYDTFEHAGCTVRIVVDEDALDPLTEWDHPGYVYAWSRGYSHDNVLNGADEELRTDYFSAGLADIAKEYELGNKYALLVPLRFHDSNHGPATASLDICEPEDANVIWALTQAELDSEWNGDRDRARKYVAAVADEWVAWANGDVFGYIVENENGDEESCWGFIETDVWKDDANVKQEARSAAESLREKADNEAAERRYWDERDVMTVTQ